MTLTGKRLDMLRAIKSEAHTAFHKSTCDALERDGLVEWDGSMRLVGCGSFHSSHFTLTEAGERLLTDTERSLELGRIGKAAMRALTKLRGDKTLCRGFRPEAAGYEYFIEPGGLPFPELSAAYLIENGYVAPQGDGLFGDNSQTFRMVESCRVT